MWYLPSCLLHWRFLWILWCKFILRCVNEHLWISDTRKWITIMNSESKSETKVKRKRDPSRLVLGNEISIKGWSWQADGHVLMFRNMNPSFSPVCDLKYRSQLQRKLGCWNHSLVSCFTRRHTFQVYIIHRKYHLYKKSKYSFKFCSIWNQIWENC